ncbi:MAG: AAA family ATPase [Candidatus Aenigmarchaeota archaeon]|nr:AAA family ATPase [Candidatus Aenigmarchaeota archaeon]
MVRIERISMQGFKSFANKVVVPLLPGLNVISGPNGSGKSNIVDALCFVLGIRSTKTIRAERLNELIFKGGKKRGGAEYAVVNLYLDNSDKTIPGEGDEIKITRKVNKNGSSIYKLNGKTVNRRKIVDVLASAGIYADGHNIIMQGDITNLIEMSPQQRREIIDEVSGIGEFEDKKQKAEKELEKVDQKLNEVKIRLSEKETLLKKLEREQKLAREYKTLNEDLKVLTGSIIKIRLDNAKKRLEEIMEELKKKEEEFSEVNEKFEKLDLELTEKQKEINKTMVEVFKMDKNVREKEELRSEIERYQNKIESNLREIKRLEEMISHLSEEGSIIKRLKSISGVYGTVGELFSADGKFQSAIEVALGNRINDIVVKSDKVAEDCINLLKKEKLGRATFLPLNKIRYKENEPVSGEGIIDYAINLVKYDKSFEPAIKYAFGDTLIVKDLKTARKYIGKYRMVTLDGDLIQKSGAMTGGFRKKSDLQRIMEFRKNIEDLKKENEKLDEKIGILEGKLSKIKEVEEKAVREADVSKLTDETEKIRKERQKLYDMRVTLQHKVSDLRIKKAKIDAEIENLEMEFQEYKDLDRFLEGDIEVLQKQRRNIIEKLRRVGPVNQRAIEDYENMKILYEDLKKKVERIEKEKESILKIAESIENKRREAFMNAFNKINENFQNIFKELNGGEAHLELEDPNDIRSGLLIKARPLGKKTLSIDSMSGGEKTITALAFLFGVQMFKPAPFYILDEADAALDSVNTKKVAELLKRQSKKAQFIVISHNDITLRYADQVYGISMEDGVSKVMAIKLPES